MCCSHTCQFSVIAALPPPFLLLSFPFTPSSFLSPFPSLPFPCTPPPSVFPMDFLPIDSYCIFTSLIISPPHPLLCPPLFYPFIYSLSFLYFNYSAGSLIYYTTHLHP